jgi:hypothetical protein
LATSPVGAPDRVQALAREAIGERRQEVEHHRAVDELIDRVVHQLGDLATLELAGER